MLKLKPRRSIAEVHSGNDIRYRGPLSYRYLRVFAWLCLIIGQAGVIARIVSLIDVEISDNITAFAQQITKIGKLALPFFLLANFAQILNVKDGYRKLVFKYTVFSIGMIAAYMWVLIHYIQGFVNAYAVTPEDRRNVLQVLISLLAPYGYLDCNVFLDLLLCSVFMYFLYAVPKRFFTGSRIKVFRLFAILPLTYEIVCIVLKTLAANRTVELSPYLYPFLTTKPPVAFLLFIVLALFLKIRERRYLRSGKTREEYAAFLKTNTNSFHVALFTACALVAAALLDMFLVFFYTKVIAVNTGVSEAVAQFTVRSWGLGDCTYMIFIAPIMLLVSYNRVHRDLAADIAIPVMGFLGVLFVYVEGLYQLIRLVPQMLSSF